MPLGAQLGGVPVTAGNAIVVTVIWISGQPITVSDNNANTYFQAAYLNTSVLIDPGTAIFYACNVASTPNPKPVITAIDPSGGGIRIDDEIEIGNVAPACFDGADAYATLNQPGGTNFPYASAPPPITTTHSNELIFGFSEVYSGYSSPGSGFTCLSCPGLEADIYENVSAIGSYNASFIFTSPQPQSAPYEHAVALAAAFVGGAIDRALTPLWEGQLRSSGRAPDQSRKRQCLDHSAGLLSPWFGRRTGHRPNLE